MFRGILIIRVRIELYGINNGLSLSRHIYLSLISINLLAFYYKCYNLIGYALLAIYSVIDSESRKGNRC